MIELDYTDAMQMVLAISKEIIENYEDKNDQTFLNWMDELNKLSVTY